MSETFERNAAVTWEFARAMQAVKDGYRGRLEPDEARVFNAVQFWALFVHDFAVIVEELHRPGQTEQRRNVFGRVLATAIFEAFDDRSQLLGRVFADMRALGIKDSELAALEAIRVRLRALRARYEAELDVLRHVVSAHRDHDAEKQWAVMARQDSKRLRELAHTLTTWSADMLVALQPGVVQAAEKVVARCGRYRDQPGVTQPIPGPPKP
jgi:hypothetical protein